MGAGDLAVGPGAGGVPERLQFLFCGHHSIGQSDGAPDELGPRVAGGVGDTVEQREFVVAEIDVDSSHDTADDLLVSTVCLRCVMAYGVVIRECQIRKGIDWPRAAIRRTATWPQPLASGFARFGQA